MGKAGNGSASLGTDTLFSNRYVFSLPSLFKMIRVAYGVKVVEYTHEAPAVYDDPQTDTHVAWASEGSSVEPKRGGTASGGRRVEDPTRRRPPVFRCALAGDCVRCLAMTSHQSYQLVCHDFTSELERGTNEYIA